jgi:cell wall-associated NlpC family hydrolase
MLPARSFSLARQTPRRRAGWIAIMLVAAPAWAAEPSYDPLGAFLAERAAAAPAPATPPTRRERSAEMVIAAMNFVGVPYQHGGNSHQTGFDCSGFTRHIFDLSLGLLLPRRVDDQASAKGLIEIDKGALRPGDLVFFNTLKRTFSHVGIYIGDGRFIHAPRSGAEVRIENMRYAYWAQRFTGARRAAGASLAPEATLLTPGS